MAITSKTANLISSDEVEIRGLLKKKFPTGKSSIINKGIQAITYSKFLRFCQVHKLNINLFANVMFFEVPKEIEMELRQVYLTIKQDTYYITQDFSFVDFLLACVASLNQIPVVSFDKHLTHHLKNYLTYDALWPTDVIRSTFSTPILLDTNVIYSLVFEKSDQLQNIIQMMHLHTPVFLIPDLIINELENLYLREQKKQQRDQKKTLPSIRNSRNFIAEETARPKYRSKKNVNHQLYSKCS